MANRLLLILLTNALVFMTMANVAYGMGERVSTEKEIADISTNISGNLTFLFGYYDSPTINNYLDNISQKLQTNTPNAKINFYVLDTMQLLLLSIPKNTIYISRGLLAYLNSEDTLAFLLARELHRLKTQGYPYDTLKSSNSIYNYNLIKEFSHPNAFYYTNTLEGSLVLNGLSLLASPFTKPRNIFQSFDLKPLTLQNIDTEIALDRKAMKTIETLGYSTNTIVTELHAFRESCNDSALSYNFYYSPIVFYEIDRRLRELELIQCNYEIAPTISEYFEKIVGMRLDGNKKRCFSYINGSFANNYYAYKLVNRADFPTGNRGINWVYSNNQGVVNLASIVRKSTAFMVSSEKNRYQNLDEFSQWTIKDFNKDTKPDRYPVIRTVTLNCGLTGNEYYHQDMLYRGYNFLSIETDTAYHCFIYAHDVLFEFDDFNREFALIYNRFQLFDDDDKYVLKDQGLKLDRVENDESYESFSIRHYGHDESAQGLMFLNGRKPTPFGLMKYY